MSEKESDLINRINPLIKEMRAIITENPNNSTKIDEIIKKLESIGTWHVIDPLKEVLEIPNCPPKIQQKILELFGKIKNPRVLSVLISYLTNENVRIRNTAIKSLSLIKHPKVAQHLISSIKADENNKWVKIFAIHGLTRNSSPKVVQPLIELLGDPEEDVRKEAILALTKLKVENVDDLLINALDSEDRYGKMGVVSLLAARNVKKSVDSLIRFIGNEDRRLNLIVCNALSSFSNPKSLIPLLDKSILENDLHNQYLLCIQKMNETIIPALIEIYIKDNEDKYSSHIEFLLKKAEYHSHEQIINRKSTEENPNIVEKLAMLESKIEN